jgi:hypothetical protein
MKSCIFQWFKENLKVHEVHGIAMHVTIANLLEFKELKPWLSCTYFVINGV